MRAHPSKPAPALLLAASLLVVGACAPGTDEPTSTADAAREVPEYTIDQFLDNTSLRGLSFSPDGSRLLVSSDASGIFNAYAYPVDGGEPEQLTRSTGDAIFALGYFPDGERLLYASDQGGNELTHLYVREADGTVRDLTPGEEMRASFYHWADDERSFYYGTNARDPRFFDVFEMDADDYETREIYRNEAGYEFGGVSRDGSKIALVKSYTTASSDTFLLDRETGEIRNLTEQEGVQANYPTGFTPDGEGLLLTTDADSEFSYLVRYDLATGERETLVQPDWDVAGASYSEDDRYLIVSINNDARTEVRLYEAETMEQLSLPEVPNAEISAVTTSDDGTELAFYASSSRSPRDLYVASLPDGAPRKLSSTLNAAIDPEHLVEGEVVRFASYDGVEIPGILYRPHEASVDNKVPAVVLVHGGPGGQSRIGYNEMTQYLVNHGYAVYAINNRGSSGYGKTFFQMDDQKHGEADLDDVVASKKMLIDTGWVDPERIGIVGGSYGGYMTLAALTFRPEEFAAGVDLFGISNWPRVLESVPPWWESFREALYQEMGNPETDRARLERISPLFHADQIRRPLMVLQGANDPRVLQEESDDIVEAVRANGVPVEYIVFEDEGHGFVKKENREEAYREMREFLDQYLAGEGAAEEAAEEAA